MSKPRTRLPSDISALFKHAAKEKAAREKREAAALAGPGRGTTNKNDRGNTEDRRRRREYLVETYRADVSVYVHPDGSLSEWDRMVSFNPDLAKHPKTAACRCYRCGKLLTVDTVTVDRIIPKAKGGTYARNNIRPCCGPCNSETGATVRR